MPWAGRRGIVTTSEIKSRLRKKESREKGKRVKEPIEEKGKEEQNKGNEKVKKRKRETEAIKIEE